jgi:signal peptidase I
MEPTLHGDERIFHGDRVFVNKFIFGWRYPLNKLQIPFTNIILHYADHRLWSRYEPQRWDIVVFKAVAGSNTHNTLVKRVIGLPGEKIHVANGKIYVNDKPVETPKDGPNKMPEVYYTSDDSRMSFGVMTDPAHSIVPKGYYLAMGDNSASSFDGRYWGWLPAENILGRVSCIWWPPSRWRDFTGFSHTWWWRAIVTVVGFCLVARILFFRLWSERIQGKDGKDGAIHLLINRWAYGLPVPFTDMRITSWGNPKRGDLVLYRVPRATSGQPSMALGRVAGLPGEKVFMDNGQLTVDGAPVEAPCLAGRTYVSNEDVGPYGRSKGREFSQAPEGNVFILTESQSPEDHWDSRTLGWVAVQDIVGKVAGTWWPPSRIGR